MEVVLTIVVAVYEVEVYIEQCIQSIISQMTYDMELIIVDDGTKDSSIDRINGMVKGNTQIRVLHQENAGLSSARNTGLIKSCGQYVYFIDGDDSLREGSLEYLMNLLRTDHVADLVSVGYMNSYPSGAFSIVQDCNNTNAVSAYSVMDLLEKNVSPLCKVWRYIVRRSFLIENDIEFREGVLCEDIEWVTKLIKHHPIIRNMDTILYIYREQRNGSIMTSVSLKRLKDSDDNIDFSCRELVLSSEGNNGIANALLKEWQFNLSFYPLLHDSEKILFIPQNNVLYRAIGLNALLTRMLYKSFGYKGLAQLFYKARMIKGKINGKKI